MLAALPLLLACASPPAPEPPRVVAARAHKIDAVHAMFAAAQVAYPPREVLLRAFKRERVVELWAGDGKEPLALVKSYAVCASSGELGPKRAQGDMQVPEGYYTVDKLNPASQFHLSLHVDYPNAADRARGKRNKVPDLGGDIMVHGNCVTIGCIPIEDDPIEEVFLALVDAKLKPPIEIFPARFDDDALLASAPDDDTKRLWQQLAVGYRAFEKTHRAPRVSVDAHGDYVVR